MNRKEVIFKGVRLSGILMLIINLLFPVVVGFLMNFIDSIDSISAGVKIPVTIVGWILIGFSAILLRGFMLIDPNQARVLVFFGKYKGTVKDNGFFWVHPLYSKRKISLRASNLDAEPIKVNDKDGNPVMIGQIIVWKIVDTYKASFSIENTTQTYSSFVRVQGDAALRFVAGQYAYDKRSGGEELTLRSGSEDINAILEQQMNERLELSGIQVMEARINSLAYAPEIAAVMLRRQQAEAIISAREKIVEGAVSMVKQALTQLAAEQVIELDEERKAAMVSNLLVVLCSDEAAQPVLNTGTMYH
ncbi:MAG: SPFH domain-containing protein [Prevotellaceae bacterium]|jgi:regulator of protease activity HflC (stomatin/prohibitin superfamily)|nr:SPFH domain-containing protein [Prevotellaceae bacterium]